MSPAVIARRCWRQRPARRRVGQVDRTDPPALYEHDLAGRQRERRCDSEPHGGPIRAFWIMRDERRADRGHQEPEGLHEPRVVLRPGDEQE